MFKENKIILEVLLLEKPHCRTDAFMRGLLTGLEVPDQ